MKKMLLSGLIIISSISLFGCVQREKVTDSPFKSNSTSKTETSGSLKVDSSSDKSEKIITSSTENKREEIAKDNAIKFPADSVAKFSGSQFIGMDYYFEGKVVDTIVANSVGNDIFENSFLVENSNGYRMIVTPAYEVEVPNESNLKVYGHLNGNGYNIAEIDKSGINKEAGLINGYQIFINEKEIGIEYFGLDDI
ncbi:hypothetical protein P7H75_14130 [Vagococcus carniphilus]|uniref:hypothetical protein n=1 Tax=Vagococcus carniphilus TaxID=218144 RepID=UPI00288D113F|nr:hypothetical protein [Vagococcus carniphilus]MDT2815994.1 hypothetical protein [Vagococcus carniphilus]